MSIQFQLKIYVDKKGDKPFIQWIGSLDPMIRYRVKERLDRISLGNLGDFKSVGDGVHEFRLAFGCGYRIYFAKENQQIILLLSAGDKSTQSKDIRRAKRYYSDYQTRKI
jgi:putative addiction module killer protein